MLRFVLSVKKCSSLKIPTLKRYKQIANLKEKVVFIIGAGGG